MAMLNDQRVMVVGSMENNPQSSFVLKISHDQSHRVEPQTVARSRFELPTFVQGNLKLATLSDDCGLGHGFSPRCPSCLLSIPYSEVLW